MLRIDGDVPSAGRPLPAIESNRAILSTKSQHSPRGILQPAAAAPAALPQPISQQRQQEERSGGVCWPAAAALHAGLGDLGHGEVHRGGHAAEGRLLPAGERCLLTDQGHGECVASGCGFRMESRGEGYHRGDTRCSELLSGAEIRCFESHRFTGVFVGR